ncbi:MAG: glutamate synthase-related protein, partial [Deltaproteobacteria bacterium]|nr:glutamate synthase-related protein [Deltaproteobacteria bacterium]
AAAQTLGTVALMARDAVSPDLMDAALSLVPQFPAGQPDPDDPLLSKVRAIELTDHPEVISHLEAVKQHYPQLIVWIKVPGDLRAPDRVAALAAAGAGVIRLVATEQARGLGDAGEVHLKDLIRRTHLKLVEHQMRDAVTLLASGGIALAEHVAKAIICGVDGIIVDIPLLLALECRLCRNCQNGQGDSCPIELDNLSVKRGAQRLVNLVGAWNNQLLEILGAMGMREVRRLRGEVGRAMFKEDLDKEIFEPLFARPEGTTRRSGE